ncbi:MAG TPA: histidine kinase [bacterium]|nr:histidine kinase [bacterium]
MKKPTYEELEKQLLELEAKLEANAQAETSQKASFPTGDIDMKNIFEAMEDGFCIGDCEYNIHYANRSITEEFGPCEGRKCYEYFDGFDEPCPWCANSSVEAGETVRKEWRSTVSGKVYDLVKTPLAKKDGGFLRLEIFRDITDLKNTEKKLQSTEKLLRELSLKLITAYEKERAELARELHDELGQDISALLVEIEWLKKQPEKKMEYFERLSEMAEKLSFEIWRICRGLHPPVLDKFGLSAAMESFLEQYIHRENKNVEWEIAHVGKNDLSPEIALGVFRIFQESINNIERHADADRVSVSLNLVENGLSMEINDNGVGFNEETAAGKERIGIIGMRERATAMGGEIFLRSAIGSGTTIKLRIPTDSKPEESL